MSIPNVSGALRGWMRPVTYRTLTKTVVNHLVVETPVETQGMASCQPLKAQEILRKPEEQRAWRWFTVITDKRSPELAPDDLVIVAETIYRIDSKKNWADGGFRRYEAVQGYDGADSPEVTP